MNTPTSLTIRPAAVTDHRTLVDFIIAMACESEGLQLDEPTVAAGVSAALCDPTKGRYWIAEESGTAVASLLVTTEWSDWHNQPYWWIQSVYIIPSHRGQGVMGFLLDRLTLAAKQQEVKALRLYVETENQRAIRAYEKCGFHSGHYLMMSKTP